MMWNYFVSGLLGHKGTKDKENPKHASRGAKKGPFQDAYYSSHRRRRSFVSFLCFYSILRKGQRKPTFGRKRERGSSSLTCYMCHMRPLSYHLLCRTSIYTFDHYTTWNQDIIIPSSFFPFLQFQIPKVNQVLRRRKTRLQYYSNRAIHFLLNRMRAMCR